MQTISCTYFGVFSWCRVSLVFVVQCCYILYKVIYFLLFPYANIHRCFSNRFTSIRFNSDGTKNRNQIAILAEIGAATTKSGLPAATELSTSIATASGSAPFAVVSSVVLYALPSPITADWLKLVRIYPGLTMCTVTLLDANSDRSDSQYPCTANLDAA